MKKIRYIVFLLWILNSALHGQTEEVYTRLTTPFIERSLGMYRGQMQIKVRYLHALGTSKFDRSGSRLTLEESAGNFLANDLIAQLSYGILDFVEISASMEIVNQVESLPTYEFWNGINLNEVNMNRQIRGPGHLDLRIALKQPFIRTGFDFLMKGGLSIPVSSQYPKQPDHKITLVSPDDPDGLFVIDYVYRFRPAYNVAMYHLGLESRMQWDRAGMFFACSYKGPMSPEQTYLWNHLLEGDQYAYRLTLYDRLPSSTISFGVTPAYQLYPWFAVWLSFHHRSAFNGWTEETGFRVALPERSLGSLSPGFEILVSPAVRFVQQFNIPFYGKEHYALFSLHSGVSINLVPLKRLYY